MRVTLSSNGYCKLLGNLIFQEVQINNDFYMSTKPKVISLFSGCGGLDIGFEKAGFDIVYANDIEKSVEATYRKNIGDIHIAPIEDIDKNLLPDCDVILAGIPCQPFSTAGNRNSTNDSRGNLFLHVMEIVELKKPSVVLFENVRGFLSSVDENGTKMPERIKDELKERGYTLKYQLLNASDYGVPQNRYRVIMVGVRNDITVNYEFPEVIKDKSSLVVGEALKNVSSKDNSKDVWKLSPQSEKIIPFIPEGGSWKNIPYEYLPDRLKRIRDDMKKYRSPNFYRRFSKKEIMGTVTAAATPENSGILHPTENRRYSVREIARFQSFPDDFIFLGTSVSKMYKMIGNAVPCLLAEHIANSIKKQIPFN